VSAFNLGPGPDLALDFSGSGSSYLKKHQLQKLIVSMTSKVISSKFLHYIYFRKLCVRDGARFKYKLMGVMVYF
jgi:hypothetical protein